MPITWQQLLVELTLQNVPAVNSFPLMMVTPGALWSTLAEDVLNRVLTQKCRIWYSTTNLFLSIDEGILVSEDHDAAFLNILQELSMPLFRHIPDMVLK